MLVAHHAYQDQADLLSPQPNGNTPGRSDELSILTFHPSILPIVWTAEQNE